MCPMLIANRIGIIGNQMFVNKYFPQSKFIHKFLIPEILVDISAHKNLCMEIASSRGRNIRHLISSGWPGKVIGFDLWDSPENNRATRCPKPVIDQAELIQGNILDTLIPVYNGDHVDVLFLDLDGDPLATSFTLDVLSSGLTDSYIFVDEFHNFNQWETKDIKVVANWLKNYNVYFDIPYYTQYGALIKTGAGFAPSYLLESLNDYITRS